MAKFTKVVEKTQMSKTPVCNDPVMGYTAIAVEEKPNPEVRYTSGQTIYVESIIDGPLICGNDFF